VLRDRADADGARKRRPAPLFLSTLNSQLSTPHLLPIRCMRFQNHFGVLTTQGSYGFSRSEGWSHSPKNEALADLNGRNRRNRAEGRPATARRNSLLENSFRKLPHGRRQLFATKARKSTNNDRAEPLRNHFSHKDLRHDLAGIATWGVPDPSTAGKKYASTQAYALTYLATQSIRQKRPKTPGVGASKNAIRPKNAHRPTRPPARNTTSPCGTRACASLCDRMRYHASVQSTP